MTPPQTKEYMISGLDAEVLLLRKAVGECPARTRACRLLKEELAHLENYLWLTKQRQVNQEAK